MNNIKETSDALPQQRKGFDFALPAVNDCNIHQNDRTPDEGDILPHWHLDPMLMTIEEIEDSISDFRKNQRLPQASFLLGVRYAKLSCRAAGMRI